RCRTCIGNLTMAKAISLSGDERPISLSIDHVRELFGLAGERWTIPVLAVLRGRTLRFGALLRALPGVSQKQLTHTLRNLEREGFVARTAYMTIPPKVEYALTGLGSDLASSLVSAGRFAIERRAEIERARQRFDEASAGRCPAA